MLVTLPFVFGVLIVAPQAVREAKAASRQQTSQGVVTAYNRSDHNRCSYTFLAFGRQYAGRRGADTTDVSVGDHVLVFYDSEDPTMNAIEDFSQMSRRDSGFCYYLLFVIGGVAAFVLYSKATRTGQGNRSAAV
jgi:Protein of unknown function (DUF3592)